MKNELDRYIDSRNWSPELYDSFQKLPADQQQKVLAELPESLRKEFAENMVSHINNEVRNTIEKPRYYTAEQARKLSIDSRAKNEGLKLTTRGEVSNDITNYCSVMENDQYLRGRIRYNELDNRTAVENFYWNTAQHPIRDIDLYNIRQHVSEAYGISNIENIKQAIEITAHNHSFHPIRDELNELKWDGIERIPYLFPRYLGAEESDYTTEVTRVLLQGAVQRVFNPGIKFDFCIVIADRHQGTGKSTICRLLALKDEWFSDSLGNLERSKEAYESICGRWICELSEMLTAKKTKDIESIKAFLSRTSDTYRTPYETYSDQRPRQCIFIGTSNKPDFLPDDMTGNRRFIPLICDGSKAEVHPLKNEEETRYFIRQCYAEAICKGQQEGWSLTIDRRFDDELEEIRKASTPEDPRIGMIQAWLDTAAEDIVCSRMIYDRVFASSGDPSRYELNTISEIMTLSINGWERYGGRLGESKDNKYRFANYGKQRAWKRTGSVPTAVPAPVPSGSNSVPSGDTEGFKNMENNVWTPFENE